MHHRQAIPEIILLWAAAKTFGTVQSVILPKQRQQQLPFEAQLAARGS
jgi:hypothetical protein